MEGDLDRFRVIDYRHHPNPTLSSYVICGPSLSRPNLTYHVTEELHNSHNLLNIRTYIYVYTPFAVRNEPVLRYPSFHKDPLVCKSLCEFWSS